MYSFATSETLAVLTIASAASTDPMNPFVSTNPNASCATVVSSRRAADSNTRLPPIACLEQIRYDDRPIRRRASVHSFDEVFKLGSRLMMRSVRAGALILAGCAALGAAACGGEKDTAPPVATPTV